MHRIENRRPSIALVSPFPPPYGGMAIQAHKLVTLLSESGFQVIPVRTNADVPKSISFLSKIKGIRTLLNLILFLRNLRKALVQVEVVYFLTGFFNFFFWVTYPALILIKLHGKRVILSARGGGAREFFSKYERLVRPILKRVDVITTPSGFLKDAFVEAFNIKPVIVPNIADLEQFKFRERTQLQPRLLVTRSLEEIYNVGCVIKAFQKVHNRFPDSRLGVVGDGRERSKLEALVYQLGLSDSVTFYGCVAHEKIQDIYDQYDIFVNASNVDNLPGTILEAFASGLPVVSTNPGGIPYMVEDGVTGLLVEKEDYNALADNVIKLLEQPEFVLSLSRNAREECSKYSWEHVKIVLLPLLMKS